MSTPPHIPLPSCCIALSALFLLFPPPAAGEIIYETEDPFDSIFGLWGYDVCEHQSVALRFTPPWDCRFDRAGLWFMNNNFSGQLHPDVTITLRTDDDAVEGVSMPSLKILETMSLTVSAVGWNPVLEHVKTQHAPMLRAGVNYWIVALSDAPCGQDGVWNIASSGLGFMANTDGAQDNWYPGNSSAVTATIIEATPALAGDNDLDGDVDLFDFAAFEACFTGPQPESFPSGCTPFDFDVDRDVDMADFSPFQITFTTPP